MADSRPGPPPSGDITVQDTGIGLAAIRVVRNDNVQLSIPAFTPGTTSEVVVTGTLIDSTNGSFEIESVDVAGNASSCNRIVTASNVSPPILFDDFNDNSLDTLKWTANDVFSGFSDLSLPLSEISPEAGDWAITAKYEWFSLSRYSHDQ
ncbi:MAG: hypothetical protein ABR555_06690 [Pyrinomonadaceae bacterium]